MNPGELLQRIANTLKRDVGPAIEAEYPKTQAFMAAVVLQKLGRQLDLEGAHRAADAADLSALLDDLVVSWGWRDARERDAGGTDTHADTGCGGPLHADRGLYASRAELGAVRFDALLGRVRGTLRASIDRRMEYAA